MTSTRQPNAPLAAPVAAADVIDFLRANPNFLDQHPQLLSELNVPHGSGSAVSLVERQVGVLREESARQKKQFEDVIHHARSNELLTRKIHILTLALMNAVGLQAIFASLESGLCEDFGADRVAILVFAESAAVDGEALASFVGAHAPARTAFAPVIGAHSSACGPLDAAQAALVFDGAFTGSAVVMPLNGRGWDGVVVCASNDPTRYSADMGTELLDYLRDVATLVITPWVKRSQRA
jgi:uncharacterized protein